MRIIALTSLAFALAAFSMPLSSSTRNLVLGTINSADDTLGSLGVSLASVPRSDVAGGLSGAGTGLKGITGAAAGQTGGGAKLGKVAGAGAGKASGGGRLGSRNVVIDLVHDVDSSLSGMGDNTFANSVSPTVDGITVPLQSRNFGHSHGGGEAGGGIDGLGNDVTGMASGADEVIARNDIGARNVVAGADEVTQELGLNPVIGELGLRDEKTVLA